MLIKTEKETIAQNFIDCHKSNDVRDWLLQARDLEEIYYNLVGGVYGDTEDDCVEISKYASFNGQTIIFDL